MARLQELSLCLSHVVPHSRCVTIYQKYHTCQVIRSSLETSHAGFIEPGLLTTRYGDKEIARGHGRGCSWTMRLYCVLGCWFCCRVQTNGRLFPKLLIHTLFEGPGLCSRPRTGKLSRRPVCISQALIKSSVEMAWREMERFTARQQAQGLFVFTSTILMLQPVIRDTWRRPNVCMCSRERGDRYKLGLEQYQQRIVSATNTCIVVKLHMQDALMRSWVAISR
jgi:hypothetical protein